VILLTFRDLTYRFVRFVVVTVLGAVVFALLFVMTGLVNQFNLEPFLAVDALEIEGLVQVVAPVRFGVTARPPPKSQCVKNPKGGRINSIASLANVRRGGRGLG